MTSINGHDSPGDKHNLLPDDLHPSEELRKEVRCAVVREWKGFNVGPSPEDLA